MEEVLLETQEARLALCWREDVQEVLLETQEARLALCWWRAGEEVPLGS